MVNYKLHYADLEQNEIGSDIPCFEFSKLESLIDFVYSKTLKNTIGENENSESDRVYLISIQEEENDDDISEIFVTHDCGMPALFIKNCSSCLGFKHEGIIFIQEYKSYEEAYSVALSMKEVSRLCYESENK